MKIDKYNEFSKRLVTSFILIFLLIGLFFIGNTGIHLMVVVLSYLSFLEIYNLRKSKLKLQFYISFIIILCFLITKNNIPLLTDNLVLIIFYILSSLFILVNLFQKNNIHFSILGFLLNSTFFSVL